MVEQPAWSSPPAELHAIAALLKKSGREIESTVCGSSMEPTIPHGARIKVRPSRSGDYEVGQIAACLHGSTLVTHRIVSCGRTGGARGFVLTQGDGRLICDRPLRKDDILGVVTEFAVEGIWRVPAKEVLGRPLQRLFAATHRRVIGLCLAINHRLACHVARAILVLGFVLKGLFAWPKIR